MKRLLSTAASMAFCCGTYVFAEPLPPKRSNIVRDEPLGRLVAATQAICSQPSTYGYSVSGNAKVGASATIPKLLGKLFSFGLSGSVAGAKEAHRGVAQKDAGLVQVAALRCRENVFADLNHRGVFNDLGTGKRLPRLVDARKYYRSYHSSYKNQLSQNVVGNGSAFVIGDVNAPVMIVNSPAPGAQTNHEKIIDLATFMKQSNALQQDFADKNDVEAIKTGYADWVMRVDAYLTAQFDLSYSAAFEAATSDSMGMVGHYEAGNTYWSLLRNKNAVLRSMISELRR